MDNVTIDWIQPGEANQAATVLSHAFLTQPNSLAVWGRQDEYARHVMETVFRIAKLNRPVSRILIARKENLIAGVLNMAGWPHCQLSVSERLRLLPRMMVMIGSKMFRASKIQTVWARHDPQQQHWHLGPFGVLPELQRQGIGSLLMEKCCAFIDGRNDAAYLETDRPGNVPFYEKFGFSVTGEEIILGVRNWFMWRPPQ